MTTYTAPVATADPNCHQCDGTGELVGFGGICPCIAPVNSGAPAWHGGRLGTPPAPKPAKVKDPELAAWLAEQRWSEFAQDLARAHDKWGWSEKQHAAATSMRAKCEAKRQENAAATRGGSGLDLSGVPTGYYAVPGGDSRLKLDIDNVTSGKWAGWVFVKDAAVYGHGKRYGKQAPGGTYTGDVVEALKVIAADPRAASMAYGQLTGTCGVCRRHLEDETSVALGIGPVCRGKMGW